MTKELQDAWDNYKEYHAALKKIKFNQTEYEKLVDASIKATQIAFLTEKDVENGRIMGQMTKEWISELIYGTTGGTFDMLEDWAQKEKKENVSYINWYYDVLRAEAHDVLDSYILYIERNRPKKERFYEPRLKPLRMVTDKLQALEEDKLDELFIHMPARVGKLIADEVPVFTSEGWKRHGNLKVGDRVIGSDGNYTEVIAVHPKNVADYKVVLSNHEEIYCHGNHEWTVYDRGSQNYRTYETHAMVERLFTRENDHYRNNLYLPYRTPMVGEKKDLKVAPYVLGAWLGDGTNQKPWITDPLEDFAIIEKVMSCGYPLEKVYTHKTTGVKTYNFGSKLMSDLREYGMCFYTHRCEKHIPVDYLTASREQRLELLAGLLDTDGTLIRKERRYQFTTVSEELKNDVVTLLHTFGWRVSVSIKKPHTSSFGIEGKQDCYVIGFNPDEEIPCVLKRKQLKTFSKRHRISIVAIEKIEPKEGNCITVANEDGLYAVGRTMQLTHNSQLITLYATWHCARDTEKSNLYVTYKEGLGGAFLDGVTEIITDPTYRFSDVFNVKIADTDAKNNKLDLNRKKKYKTLSGKGLESGLNGEYDAYGVMILDDILEGVQDVLSPEVLKRKQTIFDNNVMSRPKETCKIIYNGTIWATNDLFMNRMNFLENDPSVSHIRWDIIKIPALDPDTDESNFNYKYGVGYSTEYYRARRAKFEMNDDLAGWWSQCQQEPIDRTGAVFTPEHMRYYAVLPEKPLLKIISHCDVALGGGDYLSFPILYCYEDGSIYCEDVVFDNSEKHITQPQVVSKIILHEMKNIHFESNQGGEGYKDDIKRLLEEAHYKDFNITSDWAPSTQRKEQRIWDRAEAIREIYFKDPQHRHAQYKKFMENLFSFTMVHGKRKHEDAADSLAGCIDYDRKGSGVATVEAVRNPFRSH